MATELDKVFSGRQPHHMNIKFQIFGQQIHLRHQGDVK